MDEGVTSFTQQYLRFNNQIEPHLCKMLNNDNVMFMNGLFCFEDYKFYLLNPEQANLGFSADGIVKTSKDIKNVKFADIEEIVRDAEEFLKNKGDLAACAEFFLGIDPVWHSMGFEYFSIAMIEQPELVEEFMDRITTHLAKLAEELCKLDFDIIWAADDIAYKTSSFFSPNVYRNVLLPYTRRVAEKITKPWLYHSDGNLLPVLDDLISQGMNAIHPLEPGTMDLEFLRDNYKDKIAFTGGVALTILEGGTVEETIADTKRLLDIFKGNASYLCCTCNTVTPNVKPENLKAMLETLQEYGDIQS
jgi:hypothetical protein